MALSKTTNLLPMLDFMKKNLNSNGGGGKLNPKQVQQAIHNAADFAAGQKEFQKAAPGLGLNQQAQQKLIQAAAGDKAKLAESVGQIGAPPAGGGAAPVGGGAAAGKGGAAPPAGGGSAAGGAGKGSCANGRCSGASGQGGNALGGSSGCPNGNCGGSGQGIPTEKFIQAKDMLTKNGGKMDASMEGKLKALGLPDNFINYFKQPHVQTEMENANKEAIKAEEAKKAEVAKQVATGRQEGKAEGVKEATQAERGKEGFFERAGQFLDGRKVEGSDANSKVKDSEASSKAATESKSLSDSIGGFMDKAVDTVKAAGNAVIGGAEAVGGAVLDGAKAVGGFFSADNSPSDTGNLASTPTAPEPTESLASADPAPAPEPMAAPEPAATV